MKNYELITIVGPTASGKTSLACRLAYELNTEIISADSRQVYRGMDIGTGKDLEDYTINGTLVPYHLIDILPAGAKYNIYEYQHDFHLIFSKLKKEGKVPVLCGGSGLYVESVLRGYSLVNVPRNHELREQLEPLELRQLTEILKKYKNLHNTTDIEEKRRAIRAIEIEEYKLQHPLEANEFPPIRSLNIGVDIARDARRVKISVRLRDRINNGMIEEVQTLLNSGLNADDLIYYGLEYKYLTLYLLGKLSKDDMITQLEIAIHQFAKRQMTWFRGMEKRGLTIHWLSADMPMDEKVEQINMMLNS